MFDYTNGAKYACIEVYTITSRHLMSHYVPYKHNGHINTDDIIKAKAQQYGTITEVIKNNNRVSQVIVITL